LTSPQGYRISNVPFAFRYSSFKSRRGVKTEWGFQAHRQSPTLPLNPKRVKSKAPSLRRNYPVSSVQYGPFRHPKRPGLALASCQLTAPRSPLGFPVLRLFSCACMPSSLPRQVRWKLFARTLPSSSAFPEYWAGRPLHCGFRGLLNVYSRYGLHAHQVAKRPSTPEAPAALLPPLLLRLLPGGANQFPGGSSSR